MGKIEEIEQQFQKLPPERVWKAWDAKVEADAGAGKFDELVAEAKVEYLERFVASSTKTTSN